MDRENQESSPSFVDRMVRFCLHNRLIVWLGIIAIVFLGLMVAPFDWNLGDLPRNPVPVDAIPDIGENQQIVFTSWPGRSPQDVEDQITYPLASALLAVPGVSSVRAFSMFGFSSIYIILNEQIDFYWSRSRILEKLNSLPSGTLPSGVIPTLGPDATALGQIFWYTIEGQDKNGDSTGGWDLQELRSVQDWIVRYALLSAEGVSEVASIGGFVKEYQVDVDPEALRGYEVTLKDVFQAVKGSNLDVGARTIEVNNVEYIIRGIGFIKTVEDLQNSVVTSHGGTPIFIKDVAHVSLGPALRRGVLNKEGAEAVGGVVVARYGYNPLKAIKSTKEKILEISKSLPKKILPDGTESQLVIVPFYDRTTLIYETLGTLNHALVLEMLVAIIVILFILKNVGSSLIIAATLPLSVLICFIFMKAGGIDANIVSLSGIAIAIGTIVDAGIVVCENILNHLSNNSSKKSRVQLIYQSVSEVSGAIFTAIATTIVGFLPVFAMMGAEGKLFKPLAFTKTFVLIAAALVAFTIVPVIAYYFLRPVKKRSIVSGNLLNWVLIVGVIILLTYLWHPLGSEKGLLSNVMFVGGVILGVLVLFQLFYHLFPAILKTALRFKKMFLTLPVFLLLWSIMIWGGVSTFLGWLPQPILDSTPIVHLHTLFPGLGKEFLPPLDEGAFLYMPTTMPHASISEVSDILQRQNNAIMGIPEVTTAVGKLGRVDSALDPAPISMIETVIQYTPMFLMDDNQKVLRFSFDSSEVDMFRDIEGNPVLALDGKPYQVKGKFLRDKNNQLVPDRQGMPFRLWRPELNRELNPDREYWEGIRNSNDIWDQIVTVSSIPGTTISPKLQPIIARIVMLQSGMRAPMGIKIFGPSLEAIENAGIAIEAILKEVPEIVSDAVAADRIIAKPYYEIAIDRQAIARYGIRVTDVQHVIEVAIGGMPITTTVEGRERYPVRVRYQRELRDQLESIGDILVSSPKSVQIPLSQLAEIAFIKGPQVIKSENGFLVGYLTFDKHPQFAEVNVVHAADSHIKMKVASGEIDLGENVTYTFAGNFENQVRAEKKLKLIVPITLLIILVILYFQFRSVITSLIVFSSILVAWSGGFILIWLYGEPWFSDFSLFDVNMRDLFQMHSINLSVAIWVGFLALFGIASDNGVLIASRIDQKTRGVSFDSIDQIYQTIIDSSQRRLRPALMASATTFLSLLPVLTATGRGADIMIPMAIPSFGGIMISVITIYIVPVLYSARIEAQIIRKAKG